MRHQSGFALPLVLWMIALLVAGIAWMAQSSSTQAKEAAALARRTQGEAAAQGGIVLAMAHMAPGMSAATWRPDGRTHEVPFEDGILQITIRDESAKLDINAADPALLKAQLVRARLPADQVTQIVEGVAAVRHAATLRRNGLQDAVKGNSRFFSVAALTQLPGVSPEAVAMGAPTLTVYTGAAHPDPAAGKGAGSGLYDIESVALRAGKIEGRVRVIARAATGYDGRMNSQWLAWEHGQWAPSEIR